MIFTPIDTTGTVRQLGRSYAAPGAPFDVSTLGLVTDLREAQGEEVDTYGAGSWVEVVCLGYYESCGSFKGCNLTSFKLTDTFLTFRAPLKALDINASMHSFIGVEQ